MSQSTRVTWPVSYGQSFKDTAPRAGEGDRITIEGVTYQRVQGRDAILIARDGGQTYAILRTLP